jgi:anti-anti-sigma regulatory factor
VDHAAVIIILRGRLKLGSTAIGVFERYAKSLQERNSRLYLAEVGDSVRSQLEKTRAVETIGTDYILPAGDKMLASL